MNPNAIVYIVMIVLNAAGLVFLAMLRPKPEFRWLQALIAVMALISIIVSSFGLHFL